MTNIKLILVNMAINAYYHEGSYAHLIGGFSSSAMVDFTGGFPEVNQIKSDQKCMWPLTFEFNRIFWESNIFAVICFSS